MNDLSFDEVNKIIKNIVQPVIPLEYRLYYDDFGKVITYTTEKLPGNYIVITKEQYVQARHDVLVKNNELIKTTNKIIVGKLVKNKSAGVKTSKYDINILTDVDYIYWKLDSHEN